MGQRRQENDCDTSFPMPLYHEPSPLPHGPRYQLLHQDWRLIQKDRNFCLPAQVPGCVHTDLRREALIDDPFFGNNELSLGWIEDLEWSYERRFSVAASELQKEHVHLVFEGLDTLAEIQLNGVCVGRSENMFTPLRLDVKQALCEGTNELRVIFSPTRPYIEARKPADFWHEWNDTVGGASLIRKMQCNFGWDWGPRFVTAGIWKPVRLESWNGERLGAFQILQTHAQGSVSLELRVGRLGGGACAGALSYRLKKDGKELLVSKNPILEVPRPELWWPVGQGAQPLYTVEVELHGADGELVDKLSRRIGLRTVALDRQADQWGECFQFLINGRPIFAKGGNWIPAHCFVTEVKEADYSELLRSCVQANHNMVRVWGGGIYEADHFYDQCDELGLMVWQDFMFSCALYRGQEDKTLYREEISAQVLRLAHHCSIALWCGNNEIEFIKELDAPNRRSDYDFVFNQLIPSITSELDPQRPYWPCSPHKPGAYNKKGEPGMDAGDTHDWDVWHQLKPAEHFESTTHRFVSEFGMQSFPHHEVAATFCAEGELNINSRTFENHQKHLGGNNKIFNYLLNYYAFPKDHASLSYLSQINQALCIRIGVEHWRRLMPRCMGALYWQVNDCWPVSSWSSIDFGGRWRALHWASRRFFAPVLLTAKPNGMMKAGHLNYYKNTISGVQLHTVNDAPEARQAKLQWTLFHVDGRIIKSGGFEMELLPRQSLERGELDFSSELSAHGAESLLFLARLETNLGECSESTALFTLPRFVKWKKQRPSLQLTQTQPGCCEICLSTQVPLHQLEINLPGIRHHPEDNFIDLWPGEKRKIKIRLPDHSRVHNADFELSSLVDALLG